MIGHERKEYGFDRLFEAVRYFPENVPLMLKEDPSLINCENYAGETVLQYFSMEGRDDIVELLLSCGARADEWSVYFACGPGHESTIDILLAAGARPNCQSCAREMKMWGVTKKKMVKIKSIFNIYGHELEI